MSRVVLKGPEQHSGAFQSHSNTARMTDDTPSRVMVSTACDVRDGVPPDPQRQRPKGRLPTSRLHQITADAGIFIRLDLIRFVCSTVALYPECLILQCQSK